MIKSKPNHLYRLGELALIIGYWIFATRIIVFLEFFSLFPDNEFMGEPKVYKIFRDSLFASGLAGLAIGLSTGLSELYVFQRYYRNKPFYVIFLSKMFVYLINILIISVLTVFFYNYVINKRDVLTAIDNSLRIFSAQSFYHLIILGLVLSLGINFILIMKNKIGAKIFYPLILGKYHSPKEEERIFLFIDLISSVQMAEQLGHVKYSQLLQDCFNDLSELVISYRGGVYQFVGDEVVVTWKSKRLNNYNNAVMLFFAFQRLLIDRSDFYNKKYGLVPVFKGAINSGNVMVAEVGGSVKTEVAFHGDVLNTAARMMELCKIYKVNLVLSENVVQYISPAECGVEVICHGEFQLRGKDEKMKVYSGNCPESVNLLS